MLKLEFLVRTKFFLFLQAVFPQIASRIFFSVLSKKFISFVSVSGIGLKMKDVLSLSTNFLFLTELLLVATQTFGECFPLYEV